MTQQKKKNSKKIINLLKFLAMFVILGLFLGIGAGAGLVAALVKDDPVRSQEEIRDVVFKNNLTGIAYFSNNESVGMLRADEDRRFIQYNEIPKNVYNAFLAIEDRAFEEHHGINFKGFGRAVLQQLLNSDVQTGGSTITQQLAKLSFYSFERSYERKAREIFLSFRMERILSKPEIFTAYVNKIHFGKAANLNNVYGIQAAARGYFNKDANDLNLAESAFLAGIPQRPTAYSSFNSQGFDEEGYNLAKKRQELVLSRMLEEEFISKEEYEDAKAYDIKASFDESLVQKKAYNKYPYLMLEIENRAAEKLLEALDIDDKASDYNTALEMAKQELLTGGYKVYTTIDKTIYEVLNSVAKNPENFSPAKSYTIKLANGENFKVENALEEVGATLIDNKSGAILGFVGGRDFSTNQVNHSNFRGTTNRQPGSSIKPILDYAPGLELGKIQPATPIDDIPLPGDWEPENWNHKYNGRITARHALNWSYNIPAVKVYQMVGKEQGYEFYTKLGYNIDKKFFLQAGDTPAIGTLGTSPEEMTRAYTTFANGGTYIGAYMIEKIEDVNGNVIFENQSKPEVVFSEQTSYLMTDMLRTVVTQGTGGTVLRYLSGLDIAGKTGTTNDTKDVWFVGYTPEVSLGVWVGYSYPYKLNDGAIASKVWAKMLAEVIKANPEISPKGSKFEVPDGLVKLEVSSTSGKLPSELTREAGYLVTDWFNKKYLPTEVDDSLVKANVVSYNGVTYLAKEETPTDMVASGIYFKREPYELPIDKDSKGKPKVGADGTPIRKARPVDYEKELPTQVDPRPSTGEQTAPPNNLIVKLQGDKNSLSWDNMQIESVVGYRIYRATTMGIGFQKVGVVLQKDLEQGRIYFQDEVSTGTPYVYYVTAVTVDGMESSPSNLGGNVDIAPVNPEEPGDGGNGDNQEGPVPSHPRGITANATALTISLNWNSNPEEDNITSYNIYFSTKQNSDFQLVGSTKETSYSHTQVVLGDLYYYITAVNANGESTPSKTIKVKNL